MNLNVDSIFFLIAQKEQYFVSRDTFHDIRKYFFVKRAS